MLFIVCVFMSPLGKQGVTVQASTQWVVTKGYVGCARLVMPLTNLSAESCSLEVEEALLTIKPRGATGNATDPSGPDLPASLEEPVDSFFGGAFPDLEDGRPQDTDLSLDSITAGVTRIAGGIETILQKLRVKVSRRYLVTKL